MKGMLRGVALPELDGLLREGVAAGLADKDLLNRFVASPEAGGELAFTALVARHGPMVLGVCRRILRDANEADDAFQATFLVLARRAASIRLDHSLGPWLYGVSVRVARRIQTSAARRAQSASIENLLDSLPDRPTGGVAAMEWKLDLGELLDALPGEFRTALRLCYFEGLTHEEAAAQLGCPVGTIRSRLARGRDLLRRRLEPLPCGSSVASCGSAAGSENPNLPPSLVVLTARAASRFAAGRPLTGVVPARVAIVATGVLRAMSTMKFTVAAIFLAAGSLVGLGAWASQTAPHGLASRSAAAGTTGGHRSSEAAPIALARAEIGEIGQDAGARTKREGRHAGELPADFPAFVVETQPALGDVDVDPSKVKEIRVVFSKSMMDKTWSWTKGDLYAFPESTGPVHYLADRRTCVMPVKLEAGKTYVIGINGGRFNNFRAQDGGASLPSTLAFRTAAAR